MRSSETAPAADSGAPSSSAEPPRGGGIGSAGCDEEVGSRPQNAEGNGRAEVEVSPMPPTPPDASTARDVGTQSLAAPAAPEVRVESVPAPAHPHPAPVPRPWSCSGIPWTKLAVGGLLGVVIGYAFYKWGLPLLSEKVLLPIMRWEATSFGRPVLAIVLVVSLSLFPTVLLPSTPCMWLTGIIFGYGLGSVIIMVGTAIGMTIPYWIGSLFLHRFHGWLEKKWPQQIALIKLAGKGGWFKQFRVVVLLRISPFPYVLFNYVATITHIKYIPYICGSVVGMVPDTLVNIYSGRLILALADLKYDKRRMTTVEIVYNVISAVVAVLIGVGFTVYARRALDGIQSAEPEPAVIPTVPASELRGSHPSSSTVPVDVV
ncbi:unnamed protein product [Alopecurus aequalis]